MLIDTHIWIWWVNDDPQLSTEEKTALNAAQSTGIGVSVISCWEVAKLVENGKLNITLPTLEWLHLALAYPGVRLMSLTPEVAADSTQLPGEFHKDPADQIIVATARVYQLPLMTRDTKIRAYPHVQLVSL